MPKDLRHFLSDLNEQVPGDIVNVDKLIDPKFEIMAFESARQ